MVCIGEECEGKLVLLLEFDVGFDGVGADPKDDRVCSLESRKSVAKLARFLGSAGGVVLGIEVENYRFPPKRFQRNGAPVVCGEGKVWSFVVFVGHSGLSGARIAKCIRDRCVAM
jgi:hypothetical protein